MSDMPELVMSTPILEDGASSYNSEKIAMACESSRMRIWYIWPKHGSVKIASHSVKS